MTALLPKTLMTRIFIIFVLIGMATKGWTQEPSLDPHLEPLRPLLEKTWKGEFAAGTPEKPIIDVMRWERALNGAAVRILHSINDGAYGGETIIRWDESAQSLVYHYFTTANFMTVGSMRIEDNRWITHETVSGSAQGITEVKAVMELKSDGSLEVKSEYLQNNEWRSGRSTLYREDAGAQVIFQ